MSTTDRTVAPLAEACMAKRSLRFAESLIDYIIYMIIGGISVYAVKIINGGDFDLRLAGILEGVSLFAYYFICEAFCHGKTVGKAACGLRTVTIDGKKPTVGAIILRSICRFIPLAPFSILFGNYWLDGKIRGNWYDRLSGTYVIKDSLVKKYEELVRSTEFESRYSRRIADRQVHDRNETGEPEAPEAQQVVLAEGDKVVFRYGSQDIMRVGEIKSDGTVSCYSFDENGNRVDAGSYPAKYLNKIEQ